MGRAAIIFRSAVSATYELAYILIPIFVWVGAILSAAPVGVDILKLAAWPFFALACWGSALRDCVRAYSCNPSTEMAVQRREKYLREGSVVICAVGLVGTAVLLTCTVLQSLGTLTYLWPEHSKLVLASLAFGSAMAWTAKAVVVQRLDLEHFV